ncbi:hypothetical protein G6F42_011485 [Rhizopus arrhizus]|nr:hypothetical protein G6F42_011485 [Rhizopus arrhizus]
MSESSSSKNPSASINNLLPSNGMRFVSSPSDFDGRDATEAERWLIKLNQILKVNKVEDIETIMAITGSYLKGRALDWWYSIQESVKNFKEFEDLFKKKFMKVIYEKAWRELKAVQQGPEEDVEGISNRLRQLFRAAGVVDDGTKKAIFVASVLPSLGYEMERVLATRKNITFEDLVDEATEHEALVFKYDKKKEMAVYNNGVSKKVVSFDLDNNSMVNSNKDYFSEGSSISSVLSDLVNEMRALKISSVEQKELIQQQQHMIAQHNMVIQQQGGANRVQYQQRNNGGGQQHLSRGNNDNVCYNCDEPGYIARVCPYPPRRRQQQYYNGSGIGGPALHHGNTNQPMDSSNEEGVATDVQVKNNNSSGINVVEIRDIDIEKKNTKKENKNNRKQKNQKNTSHSTNFMDHRDIELDVNAVKRGRAVLSDEGTQGGQRKKGKERAEAGPSNQVYHPPLFINQAPTQQDNIAVGKEIQRIREKKPLSSSRVVPPDIMKLLNQPSESGVSILQYLAKDKNASRRLRENLVAIHRAKPRNGGTTVVINELKHGESGDEEEGSFYSSEEFSDEDASSANSSYEDYSSGDDNDDVDTVIDYPFDLKKLMSSQPMRTMVAIVGTLIIATVDTGAAISVMSRRLADRLGLQLVKVNKRFALTGFNDAVSETSVVAKDVPLRIGGKLRREHFCIDNSTLDKDICLLGRTWFTNHSIKIDSKENVIIIPTANNTRFIEVACMKDGDGWQKEPDNDNVSMVPVYSVSLRMGEQQEGEHKGGNHGGGDTMWNQGLLNTYHEDIVSVQDSEDGDAKRNSTLEEVLVGVPTVVQDVVRSNLNTFYEYAGLGRVNNVYHEIITTSEEPIQSKPYRLTVDEEECLKEELQTLLELDIIRPSSGKYTSPVFFVPKKDGKLRLVVNFQKLNAVTVKDGYPLPHIDDILDAIGGYQCYTVLDAAFGFWQIPLHPNSIEKSGFISKMGVFSFTVMAMGLMGSPSTYQRCVNNILQEYLGVFVYAFIDDYVVYSRNPSEHAVHLQKIFDACNKANLKLKLAKCQFSRDKVVYLGHQVGSEGLQPTDSNIKKMMDMREPRDKDEVRSFLGSVGYYRRFIDNFAGKAEPITKLLKKNCKFEWGTAQRKAFNYLQSSLISPPILSYPIRAHVKIITCDASLVGLSCILSQSPDGDQEGETVIAYGSKTLNNTQKNYAINHLEAMAVVWAVNRYRHYLSSREEFVIRTDHAALVYIFNSDKPSPKLQRWKACLLGYRYRVEYRPGKENPADTLSRLV